MPLILLFNLINNSGATNIGSHHQHSYHLRQQSAVPSSQYRDLHKTQFAIHLLINLCDLLFWASGNCFWAGTSPFCHGQCRDGFQTVKVDGKSDGKPCLTGTKSYCCPPGSSAGGRINRSCPTCFSKTIRSIQPANPFPPF